MDEQSAQAGQSSVGEREPLLGGTDSPKPTKKPFYRARPLWLVPFAITAALVRGMTMAPRVEVFTQLACAALHHHAYNHTETPTVRPEEHLLSLYSSLDPLGPHTHMHPAISFAVDPTHINLEPSSDDDGGEDDPRKIPSPQCVSDPAVQAGAARLQTIMTTVMGTLSALSTGWWGHFSERHGRTRVLAISTLGWMLTDTTFILVATPGSPFAIHHHKLLVIAPIIEGLLGGWSTLQSATSAYVSDCTSPGSRATIFSRFTGVFFLGFSVGPMIGGWIIKNGIPGIDRIGTVTKEGKSVTEVFWLAISLSLLNFLLVTFLFPESLSKEKRAKASLEYHGHGKGKDRASSDGTNGDESGQGSTTEPTKKGFIRGLLSPLALFLPKTISETTGNGIRKRKDWSLTFLALSMLFFMLSTGIYQIKYLYAVHVYDWGPDKLSYYISFLGGLRAVALLFLLPKVISIFKPKPKAAKPSTIDNGNVTKQAKPKPTKAHLASEIHFDLLLTRCCIFIDILSQFLVAIFPAPVLVHHMLFSSDSLGSWTQDTTTRSTVLFVFASGLSSLGSGFIPAVQSLALCIVQARQLLEGSAATDRPTEDSEIGADVDTKGDSGIGRLFGALSVLQAAGQMIVGPMLFGLIYSNTVADFPKAIFVTGGGILTAALICGLLVRSPVERERVGHKGKGKGKGKRVAFERERGRSRVSKDLFGRTESSEGDTVPENN